MKSQYRNEILIALSIANILFIGGWRRLIYPNSHIYHIKYTPSLFDYLSLMVLVILMAGCFLGGVWIIRYFYKNTTPICVKILFFCVFLISLNSIRIAFYDYQTILVEYIGRSGLMFTVAIFGILGLILIFYLHSKTFSVIQSIALILFPFVFITFSQALLGVFSSTQNPASTDFNNLSAVSNSESSKIKSKVIWIMFDELDYEVAFEKRPSNIKMPEFDRLTKESIFTTRSKSPATDTLESIPSLLTGKKVTKSVPISNEDLKLTFENGESETLSKSFDIFSEVKGLGGNSAVVGWYHSYCRTFKDQLVGCHWESYDHKNDFFSDSFVQSFSRDAKSFFVSLPMGYRLLETFNDELYVQRHNRMMNNSIEFAVNENVDLTLIHLPFPHGPFHYNKDTDKFTAFGSYPDNLVLSDKMLGKIRKNLEKNNLWENSDIIVTSDHQLRFKQKRLANFNIDLSIVNGNQDNRIPLFIKLKNQNKSIKVDTPLNTIITKNLILKLLQNEFDSPNSVETWLKENSNEKK